ncbi:ABC transporter permease [Acidicapsa dinghuensis]|uniref:ABC transporter permease n=1 Tax=Acidicapsa dinghuensis TaxID=2218256 RepID=A0ABW1EIW3_9BACT|nr:ABC transporter permease [Acidicapsa dinghuensis]
MQVALQDLRFAFRQIIRNPGFSLTAVLSLTLGIGATVAVYSILYDAVLHPWPYAGIERICDVWLTDNAGHEGTWDLTGPQIRQLRQSHAVEDVVTSNYTNQTVTGGDIPEDVVVDEMSGSHFQFLGLTPVLGRYITPTDVPDGQDPQPVAVLSYKFWQRHYRGDPAVVGKTIQLNHKTYTILGVMPMRFTWRDGDIYTPLKMESDQAHRYGPEIKLKPGISFEAAAAEFRNLYQEFDKQTPNVFPKQFKVSVRGLADTYTRDLKKTMYLLFGAVALLLAIGCGNVSILLLARGTARQHEFAVRSAVGASQFRIVRQLLTESLLLSGVGAGLGVFVAYQSIAFIVPRLPDHSYPYEADFHINLPVLFFSVGLAILSGVVFGLFPALQSSQPKISQVMQAGTRRLTGSVKGRRMHTALIAGQIALTLLLMTAAGAAIQSFVRMNTVSLGYETQHTMSVEIPIRENAHTTWADRGRFLAELRDKIAATPGILSVGISTNATPPNSGWRVPVEVLGKPAAQEQEAHVEFVSPEYFSTLRIPFVKGRVWEQSEVERGATLVLVNQAFVRHYLAGEDAVGHSLRVPQFASLPPMLLAANGITGWLQIIGVVSDSLDDGLDKPVAPAVYAPYTLVMPPFTQVLVRTQSEPLVQVRSIRQRIASIDPDQQIVSDVRDLQGWIQHEPEFERGRLISILFGAFAFLGLTLAAVGLYSVVSYTVLQRTSELGVRVALGARRRDVLSLVARSAATSIGIGIAAGLALSFSLNRLIANWIESGVRDPFLILAVALILIAVAALACLVPARRATAIDPMVALRCE